jgi:hypothetical protein
MTEQELQQRVENLCRARGLLFHHCKTSYTCAGPGLPDLIIVGARVIFAELKIDRHQRLRSEQVTWMHAIEGASNGIYCLWTWEHLNTGVIEMSLDSLVINRAA